MESIFFFPLTSMLRDLTANSMFCSANPLLRNLLLMLLVLLLQLMVILIHRILLQLIRLRRIEILSMHSYVTLWLFSHTSKKNLDRRLFRFLFLSFLYSINIFSSFLLNFLFLFFLSFSIYTRINFTWADFNYRYLFDSIDDDWCGRFGFFLVRRKKFTKNLSLKINLPSNG